MHARVEYGIICVRVQLLACTSVVPSMVAIHTSQCFLRLSAALHVHHLEADGYKTEIHLRPNDVSLGNVMHGGYGGYTNICACQKLHTYTLYSGTPLMWTPLGLTHSALIRGVSLFQGLFNIRKIHAPLELRAVSAL